MPSSRSVVVRNPKPEPITQSDLVRPRREKTTCGVTRGSAVIDDGLTTEASLCEWTAWFARFHTDPSELYVPLALRTVDCVVTVHADGKQLVSRTMRCIREVAKFNGAKGVRWSLIIWIPGLPGVQFQRCANLDAAMTAMDSPPAPLSFLPK